GLFDRLMALRCGLCPDSTAAGISHASTNPAREPDVARAEMRQRFFCSCAALPFLFTRRVHCTHRSLPQRPGGCAVLAPYTRSAGSVADSKLEIEISMSENGETIALPRCRIKPMQLQPEQCYAALKSRDVRFDGMFYVGVSSTGIYCRPVCRVRMPAQENCHFFFHAASAEAAGYRPCLRCRPELAPGVARPDADQSIADRAVARIEAGALSDSNLDTLAAQF